MTEQRPSFDPVLLDLAATADYVTVVNALDEYASKMDWEAEKEIERVRDNPDVVDRYPSEEERYREDAARARRIAEDLERQLDANGAARRAVGGHGL